MQYIVTGEFVKINETTGTIQNNSQSEDVEISDKAQAGSGIILHNLNKYSFSGVSLYARCVSGGWAVINVVPFVVDAGGVVSGGSSGVTESFNQGDIDDIFD